MTGFEIAVCVAGELAKGALQKAGGEILEQQLNDLGIQQSMKGALEDAIEESALMLSRFIRAELQRQRLEEVLADLDDARDELDLYMASPATGIDRLERATGKASNVTNQLASMELQAHGSYLVAIGLQLLVQAERMKAFGESETIATIYIVDNIGVPHIQRLHQDWLHWTWGQFSPVSCRTRTGRSREGRGTPESTTECRYSWNSEVYKYASRSEADANKAAHVTRNEEESKRKFINPSLKIVDDWKKLALEYTLLNHFELESIADGRYLIRSSYNNRYLSQEILNLQDGYGAGEYWIVKRADEAGYNGYTIMNEMTSKYLSQEVSTLLGGAGKGEIWNLYRHKRDPSGRVAIHNQHSGKCLSQEVTVLLPGIGEGEYWFLEAG